MSGRASVERGMAMEEHSEEKRFWGDKTGEEEEGRLKIEERRERKSVNTSKQMTMGIHVGLSRNMKLERSVGMAKSMNRSTNSRRLARGGAVTARSKVTM
jgi:hypothetical protein